MALGLNEMLYYIKVKKSYQNKNVKNYEFYIWNFNANVK